MRYGRTGVLLMTLGLSIAPALSAQPTASNKAAAEALFQQGAELFEQGDIPQACERFDASQDLDPGLGTMLRLADCLDRIGKTASAWALFREAASIASKRADGEREEIARLRANHLEQRLSRLSLSSAGGAPPGLSIVLDGNAIPVASLGAGLPVDPGTLTIEVRADGRKPFQGKIEIPEGPSATAFEIPALDREPPKPATRARSPAREQAPPPEPDTTLRTVGFAGAGAGLLGIAAGAFFAYRATQLESQSLEACNTSDPNLCSQEGYELRNDALTAADAATLSFGVGGALLLGGVVLVLVTPSKDPESRASRAARLELSASPAPSGGSLRLGGTF